MKKLFVLLGMMLLVAVISVFCGSSAFAGIPHLINYQGMLTDNSGTPLTDTLNLTFKIYDDPTAGNKKWEETQNNVPVINGLFNVILGSVTPIDTLSFNHQYWLDITVGAEHMPTRLKFTSVGYAYRSQNAQKADTASYALSGTWGANNSWIFRVTDGGDTTLWTGGRWGIARYANTLYGNADSTHVNLGVACTTGTNGQNYKYCTVAGGVSNTASKNYATVGGGQENSSNAILATVGGGWQNTTSGTYATVGGGENNTAAGWLATVGGGGGNHASNYATTVAGGYENNASNFYATVGGGYSNSANDSGTTIGGGMYDTASAASATVGGGTSNKAGGSFATVGGGSGNTSSDYYATVGGGYHNIARGYAATVAGGDDNTANQYTATVGGGWANAADTEYATVGGGLVNTASGWAATVGGGHYNGAIGPISTIPGGSADTVAGLCSFATGSLVKIAIGADYTFAFGRQFTTSTPNAVIFHNSVDPIKVGIGTPSPGSALHVVSSSSYFGMLRLQNSNTGNNEATMGFIGGSEVGHETWLAGIGAWSTGRDFVIGLNGAKLVITAADGNVGIGTIAPGYKLDVAGQAHATGFPTSSDARLKKNVTPLTNVLEKLERIRGVSFDWNEKYESMGRSSGHREIGVIAQEVEAEFPELVTTWGEEKYRAVDYGRMTAVLIEAIKELKAENEELKKRIEAVEGK